MTRLGARDQIYNRLRDINDAGGFGEPLKTRHELRRLAQFTANLTFGSMGEVTISQAAPATSRLPRPWLTSPPLLR